jgi:hypothetical protein
LSYDTRRLRSTRRKYNPGVVRNFVLGPHKILAATANRGVQCVPRNLRHRA